MTDESERILSKIQKLEEDSGRSSKLFAFTIPNCLNISSFFFYGISNVDSMVKNNTLLNPSINEDKLFKNLNQHILQQNYFSPKSYFQLRATIAWEPFLDGDSLNDFYFFYDRNPHIITNLIKVCKLFYYEPGTIFYCLDENLGDDKIISEKLHSCGSFENMIFYSNNFSKSLNIPIYSYSKLSKHTNKFIHSLSMAIGLVNQICCLYIFSGKKRFHFCNGNITVDPISESLSDFSPFFLLYTPQYLEEKVKKYTHNTYQGCYKPSPPSLEYGDDNSKKLIFHLYKKKWTKKQYKYSEYLLQCLQFPAAFVAGTDYPFEKYAHFINVIFTLEPSSKENYLKRCSDDNFRKICRELFIYYQKFLSFLRYLCSLMNSFIGKNSQKFIESLKMSFSLLPTINPSVTSPFIDLIQILVKKIDVLKREKTAVEAAYKKFYDCTIDDGSELNLQLKHVFDFNRGFNSSPITVYQARKEVKNCFKKLEEILGENDLKNVRQVNLSDHDKNKDYKFYSKFVEYILVSNSTENDIVI